MSFIQRELDRISLALREPASADEWSRLYTAQQALSWALDPTEYRAPFDHIKGIPASSEDCSERPPATT